MELNPNFWTLKEAEQLHRNVKCTLMEVQSIGKLSSDAQNYELTFNMPLPELLAAVENLLMELRCGDTSITVPFTVG